MQNKSTNNMIKDKLNAIRVVLGLQVALEEVVLIDGVTKVSAEAFEEGYELSVVAEDGTVSTATEGVYETDTMLITVDANGTISKVEEKEVEVEAEKTDKEKEAEKAKNPEEVKADEIPTVDAAYVDEMLNEKLTPVFAAVEAIVKEMEAMKSEIASMKENFSKFSQLPAGTKVPKTTPVDDAPIDPVMARIAFLDKMKNQKTK